jgi:hypothetical protein
MNVFFAYCISMHVFAIVSSLELVHIKSIHCPPQSLALWFIGPNSKTQFPGD